MRSRVAVIVTLIALAALALLFGYSCSRLADEENQENRARLRNYCTSIINISSALDMDDRVDILEDLSAGHRMVFGLFNGEGRPVYLSEGMHEQIYDDELSIAEVGRLNLNRHAVSHGDALQFAIYRYEDGAFLVYEVREATVVTILGNNPALLGFGVVFGFCMVCFLVVLFYMRQREKYLNAVMRALDRFSEGNFDARIEDYSGRFGDRGL